MALTYEFVASRWPTDTFPFREQLVMEVVADAEDALYGEVPNLDALIASGTLDQGRVDRVVRAAVIGALRNIEGFKSESEGDYSYSRYGDGFAWYRQSDIDRLVGRTVRVGTIHASLPCGWQ